MRRVLALLAALPLVATACGGGGGSKSSSSGATPLQAVKAAAQKTYAAGSEALALSANVVASGLPGGKTWLKLDLGRVHVSGLDLQSLLAADPGALLKQLEAVKTATKVGTDSVGTHYKVKEGAGPAAYDIWVGDDGYLHRVVVAQSSPKVSVTIDLSKFGERVTAAAPPAAQVYESKSGSLPGLGGVGA